MSRRSFFFLLTLLLTSVLLTGCGLLLGNEPSTVQYNDSMATSSGTWRLLDDEDTYFVLDGTEGVMSFCYYEDGALKYDGSYRAVHRADPDARSPLTFILTHGEDKVEDVLNCYVESFEQAFTQFCIMSEEKNLGVDSGTVYAHIYRISEMPYRLGIYVLEGEDPYAFEKAGYEGGGYRIPEGSYVTEQGQCLTVQAVMRDSYMLFQYTNGDTAVEGILQIAEDKKTVYLYIEHDIYEKVRDRDKEHYDTTFSLYYPPDFYLRGDFDATDGSLVVDGLYHHTYSPTEIDDAVWVFGTYIKQ